VTALKSKPLALVLAASLLYTVLACTSAGNEVAASEVGAEKKVGVLLVNHGSRSATWRQALLNLEASVSDSILSGGTVQGLRTAFMEYTEPSIATRLKEFDAEGYTDIILVPIFLTVSSHSFDDIPTIIGKKKDPQSMEVLRVDKIERYTPRAATHITPLLDFSQTLRQNILRRARALSKDPSREGLTMIAYGDATYMNEWTGLLSEVGEYVRQQAGIETYSIGWCGHVAGYNPDSTTVAIDRVLALKDNALVVPVLVAHDEMFQVKIIGDGIDRLSNRKPRVRYIADAILPDKDIEHWVVDVVGRYAGNIHSGVALVP
jgi:hypothetical protein